MDIRRYRREEAGAALLAAGIIAALIAIVILFPASRTVLSTEDGVVEMAGASFFLTAAIAALYSLIRRGYATNFLLLPIVLGVVGALSEVSFGARHLGTPVPEMYGGGELDGAHDLIVLAARLLETFWMQTPYLTAGAALLAIGILGAIVWRLRDALERAAGYLWIHHRLLYLFAAVLGLALAIDTAIQHPAMRPVEEIMEMAAALVLLFYALALHRKPRTIETGSLPLLRNLAGRMTGRSAG
ncbi:hypothetical protein [Inquilinus sp. CAU 1745]|uniref:hypothetical protein n=1 Tax=Inquilinus sp. CAU 1745 TaxID=3140369 RepID=UPI00325BF65F